MESNEFTFKTAIVKRVTEENWAETLISSTPAYQIQGTIYGGKVTSRAIQHSKITLVLEYLDGSTRKVSFNSELDVVEGHQVTLTFHNASGDLVLFTNDDTGMGFWSGNDSIKADQIQQLFGLGGETKYSLVSELINPLRIIYTQKTYIMAVVVSLITGGWFYLGDAKRYEWLEWFVAVMSPLVIVVPLIVLSRYAQIKNYLGGLPVAGMLVYSLGFSIGLFFWIGAWISMLKGESTVLWYFLFSHVALLIFSHPLNSHSIKLSNRLSLAFANEREYHYQSIP